MLSLKAERTCRRPQHLSMGAGIVLLHTRDRRECERIAQEWVVIGSVAHPSTYILHILYC